MKNNINATLFTLLLLTIAGLSALADERGNTTFLTDGWSLQSSEKITAAGDAISTSGFAPADWYSARVPSTIMGTLVDDQVYPDPFFGMNLRSVPGTKYAIGSNFAAKEMPADSPFRVSWWYRKEFPITL